ncbi:putative signal transducing protein [Deminuibacter soli]|uniref:DUF2007 domain-containing protein n=1 Tax=Deminuibacter soli TaxID=2291815 RepID=A0A3E1NRD6_9BACT|nr:DUF2007 domain-containing protein [Deminuibacter soli]RFM30348.1 DUF2007 domain-containing protein [Deminuibacter soli]
MVTLQTFDNYVQAHIKLGYLQEHGITAFLQDEYSATINPALNNAIGGIKLQVTETDAPRAFELLQQLFAQQLAQRICPNCGSKELQLRVTVNPVNVFTKLLSVLSFNPAPATMHYSCPVCNYQFEA